MLVFLTLQKTADKRKSVDVSSVGRGNMQFLTVI